MELVEIRQELEKMAKRLAAFRGLFDLLLRRNKLQN